MLRPLILCALLAAPAAQAKGLCDITDPVQLYEALGRVWQPEDSRISLESATVSTMREGANGAVTISPAGTYDSPFTDSIVGEPLELTLRETPAYDVDQVDDMLDTTENAGLADILSETRCGPEALPQFEVRLPETEGFSAAGTITLIVYFEDRLLRITELDLTSDETILFMTETALLRPAMGD